MSANRRLLIFIGLLVLLVAGGALTSYIAAEGAGSIIPVLETTNRAEGSFNQFGAGQGWQLFIVIGFILFNLVGAGLTGAAIFWFLNREVQRAKAEEPANHESVLDAVPVPNRLRSQSTPTQELPAEAEAS